MSNFDEQLHSPRSYVMLGVLDGLVNTEPYMDNHFYKQGYRLGNKECKASQSAENKLDQIIKKQSREFDKQLAMKRRNLNE